MTDLVALAIARLKAEVDDLQNRVEGALELADLLDRGIMPQLTPAAFVLPLGDDAAANTAATMFHKQRVTETVAVIIVHRHAGDRTGGQARTRLEEVKGAVRDALAGWVPAANWGPTEYVRARLVGFGAGAALLQLDFRSAWHIRQPTVEAA